MSVQRTSVHVSAVFDAEDLQVRQMDLQKPAPATPPGSPQKQGGPRPPRDSLGSEASTRCSDKDALSDDSDEFEAIHLLGCVCKGKVLRLLEYGAVISFQTAEGTKEGWAHPSEVQGLRSEQCLVKIIGILGGTFKLSLCGVEEATGDFVGSLSLDCTSEEMKEQRDLDCQAKRRATFGRFLLREFLCVTEALEWPG